MNLKKFILNISLLSAILFLYSCSDDAPGKENKNPEGWKYLYDNQELTLINVPDDEKIIIPAEAFYNDKMYPVTAIGETAFKDKPVKILSLPPSVTKIGAFAFENTDIHELYIPSIEYWLNMTFSAEGATEHSILYNNPIGPSTVLYCDGEKQSHIIIPGEITKIPERIFKYLNFEKLTVSDGVLSIGSEAFSNCTHLTSVDLGNTVQNINGMAFKNSIALKTIEFPESLVTIGGSAFEGSSLENVNIPSLEWWINLDKVGYYYENDNLFVTGAFTSQITLNIEGKPLKNLILPKDMTVLDKPFMFASLNIETVVFNDIIPSISLSAFQGCRQLKTLEIPGNIRKIGESAFLGCINLENVVLKEGVEIISENAFENCKSLKEISMPSSLRAIYKSVFFKCNSLKEIIFPEGLETLTNACWYMPALEYVYLPSTLKEFKDSFDWCDKLETIEIACRVLPESYKDFSFHDRIYRKCELIVPAGYIDLYKESPVWGRFKNISEKEFNM